MKILVTGTAGFIGFHLARALLRKGHVVVGYDNLNDYYSVKLKSDRHAVLTEHSGFTGVEADLSDRETLNGTFAQHHPDLVCNLAAQAGVRYSVTHPFAYLKSNLEGFLNVLEACRAVKIRRLVYASSSSVYGGNETLPFSESDRVDTPISLYAATKKSNELMAHTYTHLYGLQTVGLRFFTVYGPWGRPDMAAWLFTDAMLRGEPIKVFNHGDMRRDFTYVDDVIAGVESALFEEELDPYEVMNLGNHRSEDLMDFIRTIAECLGVEPRMEMLPLQPGDVPATFADIDLAREKLGFSPMTPISVGVPKFIDWYREYHGIR